MTSKQRANLRSLSTNLEQVYQIGKAELSENQIEALDILLEKRELIKIGVLKASAMSATEISEILASKLSAKVVAVIGSKIILYRRSKSDKVVHIEF